MKKLVWFLAALVTITIIYGTIYGVAQQVLRQSANDPQIQLAEDASTQLNAGASPTILNSIKVDLAHSLSPFVIVYDKSGKVVASSASLNGQTPALPSGVLSSTKANQHHMLTWQPAPHVRVAAVVMTYDNGYVLAGRLLREVEKRETNMLYLVIAGWVMTMGGLLALAGVTHLSSKKKRG